jgi:hypothetical protein
MCRLTTAAAALLSGMGLTAPAIAQDLCAALTIPEPLGLVCTSMPDGSAAIMPADGAFAALSRLTVRPLARQGADDLAWTDPAAWLRGQVTVDTSTYVDAMAGLADDPDSPFAGAPARKALDHLRTVLNGLAKLPLSACEPPTEGKPGRWNMPCRYAADGLGFLLDLRLVADGERRWAITLRTANEQRQRHFEAIANSFQPV